MHLLDYLEKMPDTNEARLFHYLHNLISTYPGITGKVMFNTPFYTAKKWMCYLSLQKKGGVEVCFVHAKWFNAHLEHLDFKKRKQVAGIFYQTVEDIDEVVLDKLLVEALSVDEKMAVKKRMS